jgi:hypothetical protein
MSKSVDLSVHTATIADSIQSGSFPYSFEQDLLELIEANGGLSSLSGNSHNLSRLLLGDRSEGPTTTHTNGSGATTTTSTTCYYYYYYFHDDNKAHYDVRHTV